LCVYENGRAIAVIELKGPSNCVNAARLAKTWKNDFKKLSDRLADTSKAGDCWSIWILYGADELSIDSGFTTILKAACEYVPNCAHEWMHSGLMDLNPYGETDHRFQKTYVTRVFNAADSKRADPATA
jgi:hypothetical protein